MSNEKVIEHLITEYGEVQTFLFCRMESHKYELLHLESVENDTVDVNQAFDYESNWWKQAGINLGNQTKLKYDERIEFIRTTSESSFSS